MWELVYLRYMFAIYIRGFDYKIVVNGKKKYFRGETARHDAERWIRDNDWDVWVALCNHNADW
jgi:hypothetical protein